VAGTLAKALAVAPGPLAEALRLTNAPLLPPNAGTQWKGACQPPNGRAAKAPLPRPEPNPTKPVVTDTLAAAEVPAAAVDAKAPTIREVTMLDATCGKYLILSI